MAISIVGLLLLLLLHQSSDVMGSYAATGDADIPGPSWIISIIYLAASMPVFPLLKHCNPLCFRITANVLTGIAPEVMLVMITVNLLSLGI